MRWCFKRDAQSQCPSLLQLRSSAARLGENCVFLFAGPCQIALGPDVAGVIAVPGGDDLGLIWRPAPGIEDSDQKDRESGR